MMHPDLDTKDANMIHSFREAIDYAWKNQQIKQLATTHRRSGQWARSRGLQSHDKWLVDEASGEPWALLGVDPWAEGCRWLLDQGWLPGHEAATKLVKHALMGQFMFNDGGFNVCDPVEIESIMRYMQHHDAPAQAAIVASVAYDIKQHSTKWTFPLVPGFLEALSDEVVILANENTTFPTVEMFPSWGVRVATAQANRLCQDTVASSFNRSRRGL